MAEYIEREALIKRIEASPLITNYRILRGSQLLIDGILDLAKRQPAADVVEVVRCKDCIHWGGVSFGQVCKRWSGIDLKNHTQPMDYCSCGERKDGIE